MSQQPSQPLDILTFPLSGLRLIEASAGTGKTYTIAGLYLRLLLGHGSADAAFGMPLPVDRILVVTFTEAATAELRARILKAIRDARRALEVGYSEDALIQQLLAACPNKKLALRQLLNAERQMDEAAIYTIHGFCQRMLTQNAFESGSLFDNEFLTEEQQLRETAVADFWRQISWQADAVLAQALLDHWKGPAELLQTIRPHLALTGLQCSARTSETLTERHQAIVSRLTGLQRAWLDAAPELEALISQSGVDKRSYSKKNLPNWLQKVGLWAAAPITRYRVPDELARFSAQLLAEKTSKGEVPQHVLFTQIDDFLAAPNDIDDVVVANALSQVNARLQKQKLQQQQLSFDDLLTNLARALRSERGTLLAERIREQYPVAMIDEFQDTDPLQYQIFSALYTKNPECGFYMIGDPKQAIYAFRGADIFTYMQAKKQVTAHYTLQTNYRSTHELVAAVNALFAQSPAPFIYQESIPFEAVNAKGKAAGFVLQGQPQTALQCCFMPESGEVSGAVYQQSMAQAAAAQIHHWLCAAQQDAALLNGERLQPNDIAVLVRSGREAAIMQQALQACGIASVYLSNRESVFAQPVVQDVARLLEACLNPQDDMLIRAAMATRLMGWSVTQLARLNDDEALWEQTVDHIRQAGELWRQRGILPMLRQWLFWYQIPERLLSDSQGERQLTDVLHLGELLQMAAGALNGEHALLRWLMERCQQPNGDADEQQLRLDSERQRVQIVTIHKSKGLQYALVLLPFICAYRGNDVPRYHTEHGVQLDLTGAPSAWEHAAEERLAEDLRLLYVALTRGIFVTWLGLADLKVNSRSKGKDDRPAALDYLLKNDNETGLTQRMQQWLQRLNHLDRAAAVAPLPFPETPYHELSPELPTPQARHFEGIVERNWRMTSYSALTVNQGAHTTVTPPVVTVSENAVPPVEPRFDVFSFPRGAHAGTFLHSLLEDLDFGADAATRQQWIAEHLQGIQLSHDWQPEPWLPVLAQWLTQILNSELQRGLSLARLTPQHCLSEMEFLLPLSPLSASALNRCLAHGDPLSAKAPPLTFNEVQGMLKGFIDLVFEYQGRFYVVDYKSNYLGDNAAAYQQDAMAQAMLEHRYDVQYQLYTLALHRYLRCRLPDYDYDRHIGGVCYLFLRGMNGEAGSGVYATKPDKQHIAALDALFAGQPIASQGEPT
ncbi:exodeoxyribonuclease V subunit beta [Tolumonas lignilytica]|uniref:exodeoxyribonuclease V subunit beta n=1 Tax=Tolumonas lignilytica TaxID=1283284 RepID=UPI000465134C|nr:exodeoxyribonuclease V subunit beta [Tolumonas lignilytica]